ncbi:hypothetical protein AGMMS50233_11140 [Endomicrobiia bacterium]|nr:hypothetical protein AGMMS50233_11140 [Endomicrobiia bacterium]
MKGTKYLSRLAEKRMRNILAIIAMFACTSICLGDVGKTRILDSSNAIHGNEVAGNSNKNDGTSNDNGIFPLDPNNNTLIIEDGVRVGAANGARIDVGSTFTSMTGNKVIVNGGDFNDKSILGAYSIALGGDVYVNGNRVEINAGDNINYVYGGYTENGTASDNKVFIKNKVTIRRDVYGGFSNTHGDVKNNEVTITGTTVRGNACGGYANSNGNAENNKVIINGGRVERNVCGGFVVDNGNATDNTVTVAGTTEFYYAEAFVLKMDTTHLKAIH